MMWRRVWVYFKRQCLFSVDEKLILFQTEWIFHPEKSTHCFRLMIESRIVITPAVYIFLLSFSSSLYQRNIHTNLILAFSSALRERYIGVKKLYLSRLNWLNISMYWLSITDVERSRRFGEITARIEVREYWLAPKKFFW